MGQIDDDIDRILEEEMDGEWLGTVYWTNGGAGVKCRCCGKDGLRWGTRNDKWRLHDGRGMHVCPMRPLREPLAKARAERVPAMDEDIPL